jgi:hypothetical protein
MDTVFGSTDPEKPGHGSTELGADLRDRADRCTSVWRYSIVTGSCAGR